MSGNIEGAIEHLEKAVSINAEDFRYTQFLSILYSWNGQHENAIHQFEKILKKVESENFHENPFTFVFRHRYAYSLWETGQKEKARQLFEEQIESDKRDIEQGIDSYWQFYDLAGTYAFLGKSQEAIQSLENAYNKPGAFFNADYTLADPLFNSIKDDPKFVALINKEKGRRNKMRENVNLWEESNSMRLLFDN